MDLNYMKIPEKEDSVESKIEIPEGYISIKEYVLKYKESESGSWDKVSKGKLKGTVLNHRRYIEDRKYFKPILRPSEEKDRFEKCINCHQVSFVKELSFNAQFAGYDNKRICNSCAEEIDS